MSTLKLFGKLLLAFVLLFIFVDVMSFAYVASTYRTLDDYYVAGNQVEIQVEEAKTTNVNGYVKGRVVNKGSAIDSLFIGMNCYSDLGNELDTVYTKIDHLDAGQSKEFNLYYKCQGVDNVQIYDSQEVPQGTPVETDNSPEAKFALLVSAVILLCYLG